MGIGKGRRSISSGGLVARRHKTLVTSPNHSIERSEHVSEAYLKSVSPTVSVRRLQRSDPKDPPFGTYHTVRDEDGLYHSTLQLTDKARAAARLKKLQYKGEGERTKIAAELSAARVLWDDPRIREQAAKLRPGKTAVKRRKACAEHNARRKAQWLARVPVHGAPKKG